MVYNCSKYQVIYYYFGSLLLKIPIRKYRSYWPNTASCTVKMVHVFCVTLMTDYNINIITFFFILQSQQIRNINPMRHVWLLFFTSLYVKCRWTPGIKVRKRAKIRNRYNQAPHPTQDTNEKVTTSKIDITNESQVLEVSPFPAGEHKASTNRRAWNHNKTGQSNINDPEKKYLGKSPLKYAWCSLQCSGQQ